VQELGWSLLAMGGDERVGQAAPCGPLVLHRVGGRCPARKRLIQGQPGSSLRIQSTWSVQLSSPASSSIRVITNQLPGGPQPAARVRKACSNGSAKSG
jgi:hypothetical protein